MNDNSLLEPKDSQPKNSQPKDNQPQNAAPARRGVIARLWNGDYSLAVTFWVFGVLVRILEWILVKYVEFLDLANKMAPWLFNVTVVLAIALEVCILVGMWRSAGKYKGFRLWPILVRAVVLLAIFSLGFSFGQGYQEGFLKLQYLY